MVVGRGDAIQPSGRQEAGLPMANLPRFPKSNIFCEVEPSAFSGMQIQGIPALFVSKRRNILDTPMGEGL